MRLNVDETETRLNDMSIKFGTVEFGLI